MVYSSLQGRLAQWESAAFTRQRSLVRTQHRPPDKKLHLQEKRVNTAGMPRIRRGVVQQSCSNPSKSPETPRRRLPSEYHHLQAFCTHLKTFVPPSHGGGQGLKFPQVHFLIRLLKQNTSNREKVRALLRVTRSSAGAASCTLVCTRPQVYPPPPDVVVAFIPSPSSVEPSVP
jgi:hypothetical protein